MLHNPEPKLSSRALAAGATGREQDRVTLAKWLRKMSRFGSVRISASAASRLAELLDSSTT
jgi:hypothetical protein